MSVFKIWNDQKIIRHRSLEKAKSAISGALNRGYSVDDITEAIRNYGTVVLGEEFFFNYPWTLSQFLRRGLDQFLTASKPFENYRRRRDALDSDAVHQSPAYEIVT